MCRRETTATAIISQWDCEYKYVLCTVRCEICIIIHVMLILEY